MKSFKTVKIINLAFIVLLTLFSSTSFAERIDKQTPCDMQKGPQKLIQVLDISENQKDEFLSIMDEQHKKRKSIHKQQRDSRKKDHDAMKSLHEETLEKLQPVLSAEQLEKFEVFIKTNRPHRNKDGQGPQSVQRPK